MEFFGGYRHWDRVHVFSSKERDLKKVAREVIDKDFGTKVEELTIHTKDGKTNQTYRVVIGVLSVTEIEEKEGEKWKLKK